MRTVKPEQENKPDTAEIIDVLPRLIDLMRWGMSEMHRAQVFVGHGTDNAWDDMLHLAFCALGLPLDVPSTLSSTLLTATLLKAEREVLVSLIRRRVDERIPVPYLTRTAWFARLPFYIDKRALIPRSPFAEVVEAGFERYWNADTSPPNQILELCTGSGCIAILCALRYPDAHVVATDISEDALNVARINVARHRVPVTLTHGDLFASVTGRFDVIVANPPYVAEADWAVSPAEFHQEPKLALTAGEDGLELVRRILMVRGSLSFTARIWLLIWKRAKSPDDNS
ncbi:MAG: 50S ribosomal protein L3 N(5)-glutamine methyltransferase [Gammaproteobacteria bacterium]